MTSSKDHNAEKFNSTYIMANSGTKIHFSDPDPGEIELDDIAHGLSLTCRFAGQCDMFYSVAQHSLAVVSLVQKNNGNDVEVMQALLHDAAEAYLSDVAAPIKYTIPDYIELESDLLSAIGLRFEVDLDDLSPLVKWADEQMLYHEAKHLFEAETDWAEEPEDEDAEWLIQGGKLMMLPPPRMKQIFLQESKMIMERTGYDIVNTFSSEGNSQSSEED